MIRRQQGRLVPLLLATLLAGAAGGLRAGDEPAGPDFKPPDRSLYFSGRHVYERHCVICHGRNGDGKGEMSPGLVPPPRSFEQGLFKYRSTPSGTLPTNDDLRRTITGGRSNTAMGMFKHLTAREVDSVIEYLKFFSPRWRDARNHAPPLAPPVPPAWFSDEAELPLRVGRGRGTFAIACAPCHGEKGDGKGPQAAALLDERGLPAPPADLRQPHLRCGSQLRDVQRVLLTGLDGTPMMSFAETLSAERLWEVTAFVGRLRQRAEIERRSEADSRRPPASSASQAPGSPLR